MGFKKKETEIPQNIIQAINLGIEKIEEESINNANEGYIIAKNGIYRKILSVYPINTDFLEDRDLKRVRDTISSALSIHDRFGIYIQKEQVDFSSFRKNMIKVYEEQETVITQRKQKTLIQYIDNVERKLENIEKFYIVLEAKDLVNLNRIIRNFREILASTYIMTSVLSRASIIKTLARRLSPIPKKIKKMEDIYPDEAIDYKGIHQIIDNRYHAQVVISNYPLEVKDFSWFENLFKIDESINIAIVGNKKSPTDIVSQMNKNISLKRQALMQTKQESDRINFEKEIESSTQVLSEIAASNTAVFDTCIIIDITAKDEESLRIKIERIKMIIGSLSMRCVMPYRKGFIPFVSTLPILADNMITKNYVYNFLSSDIGSMIIFDSSDFFREDGIPIGKNPKTGALYAFNPFSGKDFYNPHMMIIGFTGSGKTFFIKYLCERLESYVDYVIKLDIAGTLSTPNSKRYIIATDGDLKLNPFFIRSASDSLADFEDNAAPVTEKILDLLKFFQDMIEDLPTYETAVLESLLQNLYEYAGITDKGIRKDAIEPTFDTFKFILNNKKEFLKKQISETNNDIEKNSLENEYRALSKIASDIRPCTDGAYANLLNGINNFEYKKNMVLDFSRLPEVLKKPVYNLTLKDLWKFCIKDGSNEKSLHVPKKVIVIDEEHEFVDQEETLRIISSKFIKQGRKYNTMTINATQDFADLKVNKHAQAILSNCNFKFLFKLGENDYEKAQIAYNLTEKELEGLKGNKLSASRDEAEKGKGILIIDSLHLAFKAEATIEEIKIIDQALFDKITQEMSLD